jgi:hypothetical protein
MLVSRATGSNQALWQFGKVRSVAATLMIAAALNQICLQMQRSLQQPLVKSTTAFTSTHVHSSQVMRLHQVHRKAVRAPVPRICAAGRIAATLIVE